MIQLLDILEARAHDAVNNSIDEHPGIWGFITGVTMAGLIVVLSVAIG